MSLSQMKFFPGHHATNDSKCIKKINKKCWSCFSPTKSCNARCLKFTKDSFVSLDDAICTNSSMLFMLLNDTINQHVTLTAVNVPKTLKMTNKSEFSFVSEREKISHECNEKLEEFCVQFCHVSNRKSRQICGSIEVNLFCSWSNFHFTR